MLCMKATSSGILASHLDAFGHQQPAAAADDQRTTTYTMPKDLPPES
jgi:hypothetical protein